MPWPIRRASRPVTKLLSEQFRLGLKNITELREAKENLLVAQQNELQSKYLALYNMQMLNFYNGK